MVNNFSGRFVQFLLVVVVIAVIFLNYKNEVVRVGIKLPVKSSTYSHNSFSNLPHSVVRTIVAVQRNENLAWISVALQLGWNVHIRQRSLELFDQLTSDINTGIYNESFSRGKEIFGVPVRLTNALEPDYGAEASGYIRYIVENYENLPDITVFVHGNPFGHNEDILNWINCINPNFHGYFSINTLFVVNRHFHTINVNSFVREVNRRWIEHTVYAV